MRLFKLSLWSKVVCLSCVASSEAVFNKEGCLFMLDQETDLMQGQYLQLDIDKRLI